MSEINREQSVTVHETIKDIIAEMRKQATQLMRHSWAFDIGRHNDPRCEKIPHCNMAAAFRERARAYNSLADRLEAAWQREKSEIEADALAVGGIVGATAKKSLVVGDAAKLREALETALKTIRGVINSTISPRSNTVFDCRDKLSAALAAPPRNCDVGTADEQYARFREYCFAKRCESLITKTTLGSEVAFAWAQMPYKEGDSK